LKADALSAQTSVNATVPIISVPLAMGMAGCLTFALSTFLGERMETTFGIGWAIGLAMASIAAGCATTPKLWHVRLFVTIVFVFLAPTLLIVTGKEELGLGWLAFGSVAYCLAVPAVEWASGTTVGTSIGKARSFRMALSGSAKNRDPFVGASFVGIMMFALPGDRVLMASLAAGYFACLFAFVSFGRMSRRAIHAEAERIVIEPKFLSRWTLACFALLIILAVSGGATSLAGRVFTNPPRDLPSGGVGANLAANGISRGDSDVKPPSTEERLQQDPFSHHSSTPKPAKPTKPPPPKKPKSNEDKTLLILGAILAAVAALLLWIAKKYGDRIQAFFRRVLIAPIARRLRSWKEQRGLRKREAQIQKIMETQANPFAELPSPEMAKVEDLPGLHQALEADAFLLGSPRIESETMGIFLARLSLVHALPRTDLDTVRRVCTRAEYATLLPSDEEVAKAFHSGRTLRSAMRQRVSQEMLPIRQAEYLRLLAESRLDSTEGKGVK